MKTIINPSVKSWERYCQRPLINDKKLTKKVERIIAEVKRSGDAALIKYAWQFDGVKLKSLKVSASEVKKSNSDVPLKLKQAIQLAKSNIEKFHQSQTTTESVVETMSGVTCWRKNIPIETVGLYIPGGSAPLFSTILMLGIPAKIAGSKEIVLCTPTDATGKVNPIVLYTANLVGIKNIYKVGGAQAIAAMSVGTKSIPAVNKIFGPGNQYVTKAKELVQQRGTAIDMPAGPSELLVIADDSCVPAFVAADLLSQAEHGADSQVVLLTNSAQIANQVKEEIKIQLNALPRKTIAAKALDNSVVIVFKTMNACIDFSNAYAPEHLILAIRQAGKLAYKIVNAGSVFIGNYSCESAGDYASGTNHTLPTNGNSKMYSGVSVDSFLKKITFQELTKQGIKKLGSAIELMADAEQLVAHKNAVTLRIKS